jgi:hypothetical protein
MIENSLELIDYVYQGPDKFVFITKKGEHCVGARINSFQIINSIYDVRYVATLNGHKILDLSIPRIQEPGYYYA